MGEKSVVTQLLTCYYYIHQFLLFKHKKVC